MENDFIFLFSTPNGNNEFFRQIQRDNDRIKKEAEENRNEMQFCKMMESCGIYKYPRFLGDK